VVFRRLSPEKIYREVAQIIINYDECSTRVPNLSLTIHPFSIPTDELAIQPLIKLQNKAIKIINPTYMGSVEEHFQHLNILCLPKLYSFSVGKFMHSYHNKLLPNHFDEYFIPLSSIHYHSTKLATSRNLLLPRVNSSSGKCSLKFVGPKVWSSIPDDIKFSTTLTFKWKLKKHLLHEKNSQL